MNTCSLLLFLFVCVLVIKDELTLDGTKPWTNGRRTQIWRIPSLLQPRRSLHCDFMDKIYGGEKKTYSILLFRLEGGVPSFPRTAPLTVFPAARTCTTDAPDKHADINMVKFSVR